MTISVSAEPVPLEESPPPAKDFPRVIPQIDTASYQSQRTYNTPLRIGAHTVVNSRVVLAPMAGVTDLIFRSLVRQSAPHSLICTEMISSNGLVYSKRWDAQILDKSLEDHPIAYQLAANRQEVLVEAARNIVAKHRPDTLDLNMGCPVKKITGNFEGCALMKDVDHAYALVKAVSEAVDVPITVKCRLGWDFNHMNYIDFGRRMEDAGAQMLTLHTRTRSQGYKAGVQWDALGHLKQAVGIPVVGNGDIVTPQDAQFVLDTYGIDAVMIGRGTQGEPWRIALIDHYLKTNELLAEPSLAERLRYALEHTQRMIEYKGETVAIREMRGQLPWYVKGFQGASQFRGRLTQVNTLQEVLALFAELQACSEG
ncbi:MAG: tRNA dihydrouridine synthase DusB [Vampirovibrio sp.]